MARQSNPSYLLSRPSGWYFRYALPRELRCLTNRTEIRLSLGTPLKRTARRRTARLTCLATKLTSLAETYRMGKLNNATARRIALEMIEAELENFERTYRSGRRMDEDEWQRVYDTYGLLRSDIQEDLGLGDYSQYRSTADALINEHGLAITPESSEYWSLCRTIQRGAIDALEAVNARMTDDRDREAALRSRHETQNQPLHGMASTPEQATTATIRFSEKLEEFERDKRSQGDWTERTATQQIARVREFQELMGDLPLSEITTPVCRDYRLKLQQLPKRRTMDKQYRDKSPEDLLKLDIPEAARISPKTVNEYLRALSVYFGWCVTLGYTPADPVKNLRPVRESRVEREEFNDDDLRVLFLSDDYLTDNLEACWQFWLPLLALFTGARQAELAQLRIEDIVTRESMTLLSINQDDGKATKTDSSVRDVPVHSQLIELGFREYVALLKARGHTRLFPDLPLRKNKPGEVLGRWFKVYRKRWGVEGKTRSSKVFHSFRHTVETRLARADADQHHIDALLGHAPQGSTGRNDYNKGYSDQQLHRGIEMLSYPALDLSPLAGRWREYLGNLPRASGRTRRKDQTA